MVLPKVETSIHQGVRCFISIDLAGSSALKMGIAKGSSPVRNWIDVIANFYEDVLRYLVYENDHITPELDKYITNLQIWKVSGDEIILHTERLSHPLQIKSTFVRLFQSVKRIDQAYKDNYGLGAKGTMWLAGFPKRNREFYVSSSAPFFRFVSGPFDSKEGTFRGDEHLGIDQRLDFLGPEIDLGFRLCALTQPGRVIVSLDGVRFLADTGYHHGAPIAFHHVGWSPLKGIYGEMPYPLFWVEVRDPMDHPRPRMTFEESSSIFAKEFLNRTSQRNNTDIQSLYKNYVEETGGRMIEMYLDGDDMPSEHETEWKEFKERSVNAERRETE